MRIDNSNRVYLDGKTRNSLMKIVKQLVSKHPKSGRYYYTDKRWTDEILAETINKKYGFDPQITLWNIRSLRQRLSGPRKRGKGPTINDLPDIEMKVGSSRSITQPLAVPEPPADVVPKSNFFVSLTRRLSELEDRVEELENILTTPQPAQQLELLLPDVDIDMDVSREATAMEHNTEWDDDDE